MSRDALDATMTKTGLVTTQTGGGISLYGWLTSQDPLTLLGVVVAIAGLALQVWYTLQKNRRETALHSAQMRLYESGDRRIGGDRRKHDEHEDAGV